MELIERRITLRKTHKRQRVLRMISGALMGILLTVLFLFGWFSPLYIADHSMEPTLMQGDAIVYDRLYKHFIELRRSDMVVFRHPVSGDMMIKRIVGLPGETVSAEDGMLLIDKFALAESDYLLPADYSIDPVKVPEGCFFVLSDERHYGEDSRNPSIGCLPAGDVLGVVRVRLNRFTFFGHGE